jgi:hypothetical protein
VKRKTAILLALVFVLTMVLPLQGFAADIDKGLETAIKAVKAKFDIPEDYKFNSSISTYGNDTYYYLSWRSQDPISSTNINATVDGDGIIVDYYKYSPDDYKMEKKLPVLSRAEAKTKADEYIEHIAPGLLKEIRYQDNYQDNIMDTSYYLSYHRVKNDVPYYDNRISVTINRDTGELQGYSRNWTDDVEFPSANGAISVDAAEKEYTANMGLRLIYSYTYKDEVLKAFPLYVPVYSNSDFAIDAFTGERIRLSSSNYAYDTGGMGANQMLEKEAVRMAAEESIRLSPEELKAIQDAAKLIGLEEAEKIARRAEFTGLTDDFELQSYYLNTNWPDNKEYLWSLSFNKSSENSRVSEYISVSINADTKEIVRFYRSTPDAGVKQPVKDIAKVKAVTDAFIAKYYPQYSKLIEYDTISNEGYLVDKTIPVDSYNIMYTRLVNGIPFPDNGISFSYDNLNDTITGFSLNWYDIDFPSVDDVIGLTAAQRSMFEKVGLGLEYKYESSRYIPLEADKQQEKGAAKLVYLLAPGKPLFIDAYTGNVVYRNGSEYVEEKRISYADIAGHFAENEISVLADFGISLPGSKFRPDDEITQKDFLTLLSKTLNYYGPVITETSTKQDIDEMYAYLIREGILTEAEKAPDNAVTREEAVKYIIRALDFDKVAEIKGIFNISFKDSSSISEGLYGYVAIAAGLGIVKGDGVRFYPKANITRGQSAVMIYNYLQS